MRKKNTLTREKGIDTYTLRADTGLVRSGMERWSDVRSVKHCYVDSLRYQVVSDIFIQWTASEYLRGIMSDDERFWHIPDTYNSFCSCDGSDILWILWPRLGNKVRQKWCCFSFRRAYLWESRSRKDVIKSIRYRCIDCIRWVWDDGRRLGFEDSHRETAYKLCLIMGEKGEASKP